MRTATACLAMLLLLPHGLLAMPAPADRAVGWPDLWGVLRAIRDTTMTTATSSAASSAPSSGTFLVPAGSPKTRSPIETKASRNETSADTRKTTSTFEMVTKQATDKVASMWIAMRGSSWFGALDKLSPTRPEDSKATASSSTASPRPDGLETRASVDVADKPRPPQTFMSSALERVRGTAKTFTEMGRAVSSTVGRWGKAMADSVADTVSSVGSTVNSAVGTVLQVINGGKQDGDTDHVCFPHLGCFSLREPWISPKRPLPRMNAPEQIQTKFFLHTRNASSEPELLPMAFEGNDEETRFANTSLLPGARTFFVVHGFNDKSVAAWVQDLKDALLERVDCNVILVDWSQGAQASRNYLQAASNTRIVGAELARMVDLLSPLVPVEMMHALGHSLGAHVAGYAGKQLAGKLGRITALDAAQPAFEEQDAVVRVAAGDARFVDVVHTNGVPFIPTLGLGVMQPVGDVDFYLNGGTVQPGCFVPKLPPVNSLGDLAALPVSVLGDMLSCSHRRAIEYFIETLRSDCRMWGRRRVEDDLTSDRGDVAAAESSAVHSSPWWPSLPSAGLGSLLAGVFSADGKAATESSATAASSSPSARSSPFQFLANVFSGESTATTTASPSTATSRGLSFPFLTSMHSESASKSPEPSSSSSRKRSTATKPKPGFKDNDVNLNLIDSNDLVDAFAMEVIVSEPPGGPVDAMQPPATPPSWCEDDCLPLGLDADLYGLKGTFNVNTAGHAPYCLPESTEVRP